MWTLATAGAVVGSGLWLERRFWPRDGGGQIGHHEIERLKAEGPPWRLVTPSGAEPARTPDGRIAVLDVFAYSCPHCAREAPRLAEWRRRRRTRAAVEHMAAAGAAHPDARMHARMSLTLQRLQMEERLHLHVFHAIHTTGLRLGNAMQAYAITEVGCRLEGIPIPEGWTEAWQASGRGEALHGLRLRAARLGVRATPTLVVGGRRRIDPRSRAGMDLLDALDLAVAHAEEEP